MAKLDLPNAGDLRHQVVYRTKAAGPKGAYAGPPREWEDVRTLRASYRFLAGREGPNSERMKGVATSIIETRYFPGASVKGQFLFKGREFAIRSVENVGELDVWYRFVVEEVKP